MWWWSVGDEVGYLGRVKTYATGESPDAPPHPISTMANVEADIPNLYCWINVLANSSRSAFLHPLQQGHAHPTKPRAVGFANRLL